ncbi:helix-turn-helix domain-containing protein [Pseudobacter ginsenosidimutans]|uniref:Helix-turn-helix protein n=1 Tax=Pseudobacter ginsenosidimutans TaxID=661488 RepID=A0A4Q7MRH6_9BACT|nr:helix-turn-helix transcriptional regulator [Pseudobacter ginsenosidimutans]QEC45684.1 helix-turn-helix transcriptional regulator [Pseudobacter ginsenosidimutans]RZS69379.1 helix-turn-helix protein [Pseudobacter ginsenosidimutans]
MKRFDEIDEHNYSSDLIDEMFKLITPEAQAKTHYRMGLAAKIDDALKAKGWKNQDLAKALNIKSSSLVSKWLSGTHNFTVDTLVLIQMALGIQLLDVGEEDKPNATSPDNGNTPNAPVELAKNIDAIKQSLTSVANSNQKSFATINYK